MTSDQERGEGQRAEEPLVVLQTFQRTVTSLEETFAGLLKALDNAEQDPTTSALEHLLVLDSAAEATQVRFCVEVYIPVTDGALRLLPARLEIADCSILQETVDNAVAQGRDLIKACLMLNKELRGTDLLAERVKQLKRQLDALERTVDFVTSQQ